MFNTWNTAKLLVWPFLCYAQFSLYFDDLWGSVVKPKTATVQVTQLSYITKEMQGVSRKPRSE